MDNREIRYNNLLYAIDRAGGVATLAAAIERSEKYLRQIVNRFQGPKDKSPRKVGDDLAKDIAKWLNEEPFWMDQPHLELWSAKKKPLTRVGAMKLKVVSDIVIARYDTGGGMGAPIELLDQPGIIESWRVSREWLHKNVRAHSAANNLYIVTGFGDSMQPLYNPGDPLLVDAGVRTVEGDAVYFFRIDNQGYVKRLQRIPTEHGLVICAVSENKAAYKSFDITEGMDFEVLGRVLKVWCSRDF